MNKVHLVSTETIRNVHMINCSIESNFDANPGCNLSKQLWFWRRSWFKVMFWICG